MNSIRFKDEIDFIRSNYANMSIKDLANELGRSQTFVRKYANKFGLKKSDDFYHNQKEKDANVRFIVFCGSKVEIAGYGKDVASTWAFM